MIFTKRLIKPAGTLLFILASVIIFRASTDAQQVATGKGIMISPVKSEYEAKPGETIEGYVKFYNATDTTETLYLRTENFEPAGETGIPAFLGKDDTLLPEESLKNWIELENTVVTVERQTPTQSIPAIVKFKINVPLNASAGGHYAAIIQSLNSEADTHGMDASGAVVFPDSASLIILNIAGNLTRLGSVEEFYATSPFLKEKTHIGLFEYPPVQFIVRIKNSGNSHFKPQGDIFIYRGKKLVSSLKFNENEGSILRESIRKFDENTWGEDSFIYRVPKIDENGNTLVDKDGNTKTSLKVNWNKLTDIPIGKYKAKLAIVYDDNGVKRVLDGEVTFWIFPWKIILAIIVAVILIIGIIILIKTLVKRRKRGVNKYME